jgi:ABC-type branched-subunit amino acid transport system ATPase component
VSAALSTRGLDKRFGSLVVASDISFELPFGARYALIGPNGAEDYADQSDDRHAAA